MESTELGRRQTPEQPQEKRQSKWTPEAIEQRLKERRERQAYCDSLIEKTREKGNAFFKQGRYEDAARAYTEITRTYGVKLAALSNYVACLLKMGRFVPAEFMAYEGLKVDPQNLKLRYRRGLARKGRKRYRAAMVDFQTALQLDPNCKEALRELEELKTILQDEVEDPPPEHGNLDLEDPEYPKITQRRFPEEEIESESEDFFHQGNEAPCKDYNRGACIERTNCPYSHARDLSSQRDSLGRNVCGYYLLGLCKKGGDDCPYIHDRTYLPQFGWWNNEDNIAMGRVFLETTGYQLEDLGAGFTAMLHTCGQPERYPHYRRDGTLPLEEKYKHPHPFSCATVLENNTKLPKAAFVAVVALEAPLASSECLRVLDTIKETIPVEVIRSPQVLSQRLDINDLVGVFLVDGALQHSRHASLLEKLITWVRGGGRVVLGGSFSSKMNPKQMDDFFRKWELPWRYRDRARDTYQPNYGCPVVGFNVFLIKSFTTRAVRLTGVPTSSCLYFRENREKDSPHSSISPVTITKIQKGDLGYVGELDWQHLSGRLVLALLSLTETDRGKGPNSLHPPDAAKKREVPATSSQATTESITSSAKDPSGRQKELGEAKSLTAGTEPGPSSSANKPTLPDTSGKPPSSCATAERQLPARESAPRNVTTSSSKHQPPPLVPKPFIIILTFEHTEAFKMVHSDVLSRMEKQVEVLCGGLSDQRVIDLLGSGDLRGVFVPYTDITQEEHVSLTLRLVKYTKAGGKVVFGGYFGSLFRQEDVKPFFEKWGLPWKAGGYTTEEVVKNSANSLVQQQQQSGGPESNRLSEKVQVKTLQLANVRSEAAVYVTPDGADNLTFADKAPLVYEMVGQGRLGFIGEVNMGEEHWRIVRAMLGL